jgi:hypothetical protein
MVRKTGPTTLAETAKIQFSGGITGFAIANSAVPARKCLIFGRVQPANTSFTLVICSVGPPPAMIAVNVIDREYTSLGPAAR